MRQRNNAGRGAIHVVLLLLVAATVAAGPTVASAQPKAEPDTMAKLAGKTFQEGLSQWRLKNYQQAGDLFSQMIKKYNGNENIPDAHLYLANCLAAQKKDAEFLQEIEQTIRLYSGTEISMLASLMKIGHYRGKNDAAGFLDAWRDAIGGGPAPLYLLSPGEGNFPFRRLEAGPARIGLCVGRQLGKAVQRNRIKRLLRESWRSLAGGADAPADLVFVARRGGADYNLSQWTTAMRDVLARAGLISDRER